MHFVKSAIFLPLDPPEVSVALGSKMKALDIKEGDDVYFECSIEAYPEAERITWKKDVSMRFNFQWYLLFIMHVLVAGIHCSIAQNAAFLAIAMFTIDLHQNSYIQ